MARASKNYTIAVNNAYSSGEPKIGKVGGTWNTPGTPAGLDIAFKIFLGGLTGSITGVDVGENGVGDARAHTVTSSTVEGNLYCQSGSGNNKPCDPSLPDPTAESFPISDGNIEEWQDDAEAGGITTGDYSPVGAASSLGPQKITGNLNLTSNSHVLTLTGTVWVEGNITISNLSKVKLDSGYGSTSGVIIADGYIYLSNNILFEGSGSSDSYVLLLTNSSCPSGGGCDGNYAIDVNNNAGAVILNAQKGTIHFANGSAAKEATADALYLSPLAEITYESGLANVNFVSGPSGAWVIQSWKEKE